MAVTEAGVIFGISLIGAMSPGPDFVVVSSFALTGSRKKALLATYGITCALFVHLLLAIFGLTIVFTHNKTLFCIAQIVGALYLAYLSYKLLTSSVSKKTTQKTNSLHPFVSGFLTNLLNPKATLFVFSLFSQVISIERALPHKLIFGSIIALSCLLWFVFVSFLMTHPRLGYKIIAYQNKIMRVFGVTLLLIVAWTLHSALRGLQIWN